MTNKKVIRNGIITAPDDFYLILIIIIKFNVFLDKNRLREKERKY